MIGSPKIKLFKMIGISVVMLGFISIQAEAGKGMGNSLKCMALNIYHEARGESQLGQVAVGMVTLNRAQSRFFQPSVCGVVYARFQFSWTFDKNTDVPQNGSAWKSANAIAGSVLSREVADPTSHASHYYNPRQANPPWAKKMRVTARIGKHVFLQMPGFSGGNKKTLMGDQLAFDKESLISVGQFTGRDFQPTSEYLRFLEYVESLPEVDGVDNSKYDEDFKKFYVPFTLDQSWGDLGKTKLIEI